MNEIKEKDGITLGDLFAAIKKNFWIAVVITLAVTVLGAIYTFAIAKPTYKASSSLVVAVTTDDEGKNLDYNNSLRLMYTIQDLIKQDIVIDDVCEKHNANPKDLRKAIDVKTTQNSYIINITLKDGNKEKAVVLINSLLEELVHEVDTNEVFAFAKGSVKVTSVSKEAVYDSPSRVLYMMISIVLGGVVALGVVFGLEFASTKFRTVKDIENKLDVKVIGKFYEDKAKKNKEAEKNDTKVVVLEEPNIRTFEPYNKLLANVKYSNLEKPNRVIMLTSSTPNELKSTISANLAFDIAHNNKKVVLLDLDTRKPSLHKTFKVSKENGLLEYVEGVLEKKDLIKHSEFGVDVITAGKKVLNPMVILESSKLKQLINELKEEYDYVLIDTPPLLLCTDGLVISKLVDGVIYNIALNQTKKKVVNETLKSLQNVKANVIGLNVTKIKVSKKELDTYYTE